jgi:polyhydroxyalkanoate synthesis regulator protein
METIVKYNNRKLYSKKCKHYVNNSYLIDLIRLGHTFEIKEHKTDQDVTGTVLASCISDLNLDGVKLTNFIKENL